jgi:hypothetical protein
MVWLAVYAVVPVATAELPPPNVSTEPSTLTRLMLPGMPPAMVERSRPSSVSATTETLMVVPVLSTMVPPVGAPSLTEMTGVPSASPELPPMMIFSSAIISARNPDWAAMANGVGVSRSPASYWVSKSTGTSMPSP